MSESLKERVARAMCYRATDHDVDAAIAIVLKEAAGVLSDDIERSDMHIAQVLRTYVNAILALNEPKA